MEVKLDELENYIPSDKDANDILCAIRERGHIEQLKEFLKDRFFCDHAPDYDLNAVIGSCLWDWRFVARLGYPDWECYLAGYDKSMHTRADAWFKNYLTACLSGCADWDELALMLGVKQENYLFVKEFYQEIKRVIEVLRPSQKAELYLKHANA